MKQRIINDFYVGSLQDCFREERENWSVVHACKDPCHKDAVGYRKDLPESHKNYLKYEEGSHLYLNLIDPDVRPLFYPSSFDTALEFISDKIDDNKILIHCNKGLSRSPSIALLYLANEEMIDSSSYKSAWEEFQDKYYPNYEPSGGIRKFLNRNWAELI